MAVIKLKKCATCKAMFRTEHGDLYCTDDCRYAALANDFIAHTELTKAGFEQSDDAPNVYIKDGVSVSLEGVINDGITKTLERHSEVAAGIAAADDTEHEPAGGTVRTDITPAPSDAGVEERRSIEPPTP